MKHNRDRMMRQNPEFTFYLFDDQESFDFIENHFSGDVVDAYKRLVPGAYKADLWRYCVLYVHGGIYLDMKMKTHGDFKLKELTTQEHYVRDCDGPGIIPGTFGIYNAVMIQKPKNPLMMDCINAIVKNVQRNEYGYSGLYPTGPGLLGNLYREHKFDYRLPEIDVFHVAEGEKIVFDERIILEHYPEYRLEQVVNQKIPHYSVLWFEHSIYIL